MPKDKPAWMRAHGQPWVRGTETVAFENPWLKVSAFAATAPTGHPASHALVHFRNHAIAVLPLHDDGTITLVGQNRFPFAEYVWEIPAGGGALDEAPDAAARRELQEETGLTARSLQQVLKLQLSNSVTDELAFGFLATGLESGIGTPDETEDLHTVRVPFTEALDAALAGYMLDSLTVAMLLRVHHMAVSGGLDPQMVRAMLTSDLR